MTSNLGKPISSVQKVQEESLFSGIWIRWHTLTMAERVVCANVALLSVWWLLGFYSYIPQIFVVGIALYDWRRYGRLRLKRPSLTVIALFAFCTYNYIDIFFLFFDAYPSIDVPPQFAVRPTELVTSAFGFALPCLIWYIQSNNIRVRLEVVAWACSVSIVQMLLIWLVVPLVPGFFEHPPRSLFGILTGKKIGWIPGDDGNSYLLFQVQGRLRAFFGHTQASAAFFGLAGLVALDLKNRRWSLLLLVACSYLLILTETRSVWIVFPAMLFLRMWFTVGKVGGSWFLCTLIALVSFITLSLPSVTDLLVNTYTGTATAVDHVRPASTEDRGTIYVKTIERIPDKLLFGHKVLGESATGQGPGRNVIGSHSFILGSLLYQQGLVGTGLYYTYWASLIIWFYNTRIGRPACCFLVLLMFTLIPSVTVLQWTITTGTLLCMLIRRPKMKSLKRNDSDA